MKVKLMALTSTGVINPVLLVQSTASHIKWVMGGTWGLDIIRQCDNFIDIMAEQNLIASMSLPGARHLVDRACVVFRDNGLVSNKF